MTSCGTPLPQSAPTNPNTPLDPQRLAHILDGTAMVSSDGVVTVSVPRRNRSLLGGVLTKTETGLETTVAFEPLGRGQTAVAPDFAMTGSEVQSVMQVMRGQGWTVTCLYNQETDEYPQLYFSHQLKVGDAYQLAAQVRRGIDRTNANGS